jgi:CHAT domain-containing protein
MEAAAGYAHTNPTWAARFIILEAESAAWRGLNPEVLRLLTKPPAAVTGPESKIKYLSLVGLSHAHLHEFDEADRAFAEAERMCIASETRACGELSRARAGMAVEHGNYPEADRLFRESLKLARRFNLRWDEAAAMMNLGGICLREERLDEAIGWLRDAERIAGELNAGDIQVNVLGNLGWAYYWTGDAEKALGSFKRAEMRSVEIGDMDSAIAWLSTSGYIYQGAHDLAGATDLFRHALELSRKIDLKQKIVNSLEDLAHVSIEAGNLQGAEDYVSQLARLVPAAGNHWDALDVTLAQGKIAAAQNNDDLAIKLFQSVEADAGAPVYMRLDAEHQMASLYESEGKQPQSARKYEVALRTFESSWAQVREETSRLPFLANAEAIYDGYINLLIREGRSDDALLVADRSRARTLVEGLGLTERIRSFHSPKEVAQGNASTLLFYWLGERQSWLWAITPQRIEVFPLPARERVATLVDRYRKAQLDPADAAAEGNSEAEAIFRMLVAPALQLIQRNANVIVLADGVLSQLNFETLIVPDGEMDSRGTGRQSQQAHWHYWIEDVTLLSAPSLAMLALARPIVPANGSLLLIGNPNSPGREYPSQPLFRAEMDEVQSHFAHRPREVITGQQASPENYLNSNPGKYSYIHFVAHAVASRSDPLDSAIILSSGPSEEHESYKLHAREIIRHPIHARLVTISACNGGGTRAYSGEGLVGLSWAFLRAGAENTIAALWEVSDESTPKLMDQLYEGIQHGLPPAQALRRAKLSLLHSGGKFSNVYYWAPFQINTRQ